MAEQPDNCGVSRAFFEPNVDLHEEKWYAFPSPQYDWLSFKVDICPAAVEQIRATIIRERQSAALAEERKRKQELFDKDMDMFEDTTLTTGKKKKKKKKHKNTASKSPSDASMDEQEAERLRLEQEREREEAELLRMQVEEPSPSQVWVRLFGFSSTEKEEDEGTEQEQERYYEPKSLLLPRIFEDRPGFRAGLRRGMRLRVVGTKEVRNWAEVLKTMEDLVRKKGTRAAEGEKVEVEVGVDKNCKTDLFWDEILPKLEEYWKYGKDVPKHYIKNFPFERDEVDRVIKAFKDPLGPICTEGEAMFRRCACIGEDHQRRVCVPPKAGFMCQRHALFFKMDIKLEREKEEIERRKREQAQIDAVVRVAREQAQSFCTSEEGRKYFVRLAQKKAGQVMDERRRLKYEGKMDKSSLKRIAKLERAYVKKRSALEGSRDKKEVVLRKKREQVEKEAEDLSGLARDRKDAEADAIQNEIENLPEHAQLQQLEEDFNQEIEDIELENKGSKVKKGGILGAVSNVAGKYASRATSEYLKLLDELSADLVDQYIKRECRKARESKMEENENLRKIARRWNGVSVADCFKAWRKANQRSKNQAVRDAMRAKRRVFEEQQVPKATIKFARWKVRQWEGDIDVWTDKEYWKHKETEEIRWTEPTTKEYLPLDFVMPKEYEGMTDEEYDRLPVDESQGFEEVLVPYPWADEDTPREVPADERDTGGHLLSLDDLDSKSGSGKEDESDEGESTEDEDEEEEEEEESEAREEEDGESSGGSNGSDSESDGSEDSDSDSESEKNEEAAIVKSPEDAIVESELMQEIAMIVPQPKAPMSKDEASSRCTDEVEEARLRMRARRERFAKARAEAEAARRKKEDEKRSRLLLLGVEELPEEMDEEQAQSHLEANISSSGFRDDYEYSEQELNKIARDTISKNLAMGLTADGKPKHGALDKLVIGADIGLGAISRMSKMTMDAAKSSVHDASKKVRSSSSDMD